MLEDLELIDWRLVKHAHGSSEHVPEAIRGLLSADSVSRNKAYWRLDNHVVLQGEVYQAAIYVVPFLLEVLSSREVAHGRDQVYDLLIEIALGSHLAVQGSLPEVSITDEKWRVIQACRRNIMAGLGLYVSELEDASSGMRRKAAQLILAVSKSVIAVGPRLRSILERERDWEVSSSISEALGEMTG